MTLVFEVFLFINNVQRTEYLNSVRSFETHCELDRVTHIYSKINNNNNTSVALVEPKSFRPDIQKPRQMQNAVRDI